MAILLTTSWQNIANATWAPGSGFSVTFYMDAKYSTQSQSNNNTTIQTRLRSVVNSGSGSGSGYSFSCSYAPTISGSGVWTLENETITSGENTIQHNEDGTKTLTITASANVNYIGLHVSLTGDIKLPDIARYPLIIQSSNFSDEDNPTITYTTSLGFEGATVEAGISDSTGTTSYVSYRQINVSDGSYTFNLTTNERNALRSATPNSNILDVMFKIRTTTTDNVTYLSTSIKQMTIVNANPTFTYTITETNQKVIDLLGSSANTIIQNASVLRFNVTPTAYKSSTIQRVMCGNKNDILNRISKYESPYIIDIPVKTENTFLVVAYDSRLNSAVDNNIQKTMIEYQPVDITNISLKRTNPTSSDIILNLEAKYYQKTFNSTPNVPVVKWKLDDGNYTTIPSTNYTIDTTNNKLTITNYTLSNALVYTSDGQFTLYIEDLLTSDTEGGQNGKVLRGIPTFDAGEHDLKVNGDLYVANTNGNNKANILESIKGLQGTILWENQTPTNSFSSQSINLSSDDYDMLTFLFYHWNNSEFIISCQTLKGSGLVAFTSAGAIFRRVLTYVSDTEYSVSNCINQSDNTTENSSMIPLYVIGYKTGLF